MDFFGEPLVDTVVMHGVVAVHVVVVGAVVVDKY